jgi:hypothetical protein
MLQKLIINETPITPAIHFDKEKEIFKMHGKSIPSNSAEFYRPIFEWLEEYLKEPNESTIFQIDISYFNSSSALHLAQILDFLQKIIKKGKKVLIKWYFEEGDDDILESGEEMAELFNIPIELIPIEHKN